MYANERSQIGIRLVKRFKLDTIYGVDAHPLLLELNSERDSLNPKGYVEHLLARHYFGGEDKMSKRYQEFYRYRAELTIEKTLSENFKYFNSNKVLDRGFGAYISGGQFASENFEGPDALSMFWFNRNLRIFKNIRDIAFDEKDRILVLFGSGHISILKWLFECSPEFDLIKFNDLEKW